MKGGNHGITGGETIYVLVGKRGTISGGNSFEEKSRYTV